MKQKTNRRLENLLQAINLADLDGINSVETLVDDLQLLRRAYITKGKDYISLEKENYILRVKLVLKELDRPTKLDRPIKLDVRV